MRDIKYKAWDKEMKQMISWEFLTSLLNGNTLSVPQKCLVPQNVKSTDIPKDLNYKNYRGNPFEIFNLILIQYTDRKDKDNVELYNGDILEYVGSNCPTCGKRDYYEGHGLYMISWDDSTLSYECMEIGGDNYMGCNIWGTDMIKVGSRYENPELLEKSEIKGED